MYTYSTYLVQAPSQALRIDSEHNEVSLCMAQTLCVRYCAGETQMRKIR